MAHDGRMIYMVDHVYTDPATEEAWHAWYADYLRKLVAVPGIHTAQRFKAVGHTPSRYLAMYSVDSVEVYESEPYRNIGGGGGQSERFHHAYQLWTRNLFEAVHPPARHSVAPPVGQGGTAGPATTLRAPAVQHGQRVLIFDREEAPRPATPGPHRRSLESRTVWLKAVGLHMTTKYRAFIVLSAGEAETALSIPGSRLYEPFTPVISESS